MSTVGVYVATAGERLEWILVKGVCDWADGTKNDEYQEMAAASAASLVRHVLADPYALDGLR